MTAVFKGKKFLSVIPARGGSKGLPRKNIRRLLGRPLLSYTVRQSLAVKSIDLTVVSSDDNEILTIGEADGAEPLLRPKSLADDRARTEQALLHAIETLEKQGRSFDFVITLEPTHPMRNPSTIERALEKLMEGGHDSLLTLTPDTTDFWRKNGDRYERLFPNAPRRRQEREPLYKENSLIYITSIPVLKKNQFVIGENPAVLITSEDESLDIHTELDLKVAEALLSASSSPS